jgi:hypothetical protein
MYGAAAGDLLDRDQEAEDGGSAPDGTRPA